MYLFSRRINYQLDNTCCQIIIVIVQHNDVDKIVLTDQGKQDYLPHENLALRQLAPDSEDNSPHFVIL